MTYDPDFVIHSLRDAYMSGNPADLQEAVRHLLAGIAEGEIALEYDNMYRDDDYTADGLSVRDEQIFDTLDDHEENTDDFS